MDEIQIIRTASGEEFVVLPRADYQALLAAAERDENAEELALYDARKAALQAGEDGVLPEAVSLLLLKGNSRLKAIRLWRGMPQSDLAKNAAIAQGYLSDLESGRRAPSPAVLRALAERLDVPVDWLAS